MKSICALVLVLLTCAAAHATQIPVRSGEHADFTRLVLTLPTGTKLEVTTGEKSARISVDQPDANFDVSTIFTRIPKTRLLNASQAKIGADLFLELGCDCKVQSFQFSKTQMVVDIRDESPEIETKTEAQPLEIIPPKSRSTSLLQSDIAANAAHATINTDETPDTLIGLRKTLTNDLQRAQFKGLIANPKTLANPKQDKEGSGFEDSSRNQQIQTITAFEIGSQNRLISQDKQLLKDNCAASRVVDVTAWGISEDYEYELSSARKQLTDESGKLDRNSLARLIKVQVYFGFGSEAEKLLQLSEPAFPDRGILLAMARSLDGFREQENKSLDDQQSCKNSAAMWSLLVEGAVSPDLDTQSLQRAFSKLPAHLKVLLAPKIGELLQEYGLTSEALEIIRRAEKQTLSSGTLEFAKASIDAENNKDTSLLKEISNSSSEKAPDALSIIFALDPLTPDSAKSKPADLVDSYRTELKASQSEADLTKATILAYAGANDFEHSEYRLQEAKTLLTQAEWLSIWESFSTLATKSSEDLFFVDFVIRHQDNFSKSQNNELKKMVSDRMTELGFTDEMIGLKPQHSRQTVPTDLSAPLPMQIEAQSTFTVPADDDLLPSQKTPQIKHAPTKQDRTNPSHFTRNIKLLTSQRLISSSETLRQEVGGFSGH